jgi:hypothetical protein
LDTAVPELPTLAGAPASGYNVPDVPLEVQLVAIGHLARMGLAVCSAELRERTGMLMRGELDEPDTVRTVGDLGLMAGAVAR